MLRMKIDMHCHVKEGSVDSRVSVEEYITILKEKGFQGMVITDHNTYNGYRYWKEHIKGKRHTDFVVLKGIEYDTRDAGHILVIMPEGVKMKLLELRGMPAPVLIDLVHRNGGVLGPAHPCGEKYLSFTNTKRFYKSPELMKRFDFVEAFNCCESPESNDGAMKLAEKYGKSTAQVILRWHTQVGNIVIPGSTNPEHIKVNLDIFDFELTEEEMKQMAGLNKNVRYYYPDEEKLAAYANMKIDLDSQK